MPRMSGYSLIEVMISVLIGLLLIAGALTVFISNRQTYIVSENIGRIQEAARVSFELLGRDLRIAGSNPCASNVVQRNVLNNAGTAWWSPPNPVTTPPPDAGWTFLLGFEGNVAMPGIAFGTTTGQRVAGTDGFQSVAAPPTGAQVAMHAPTTATLTLNSTTHGFTAGDIAMICDFENATVFKVTAATGNQITHGTTGAAPQNSSINLITGIPGYRYGCFRGVYSGAVCVDPDPIGHPTPRQWPAFVARMQPVRWYVAINPRGGRSLYRAAIVNTGGTPTEQVLEVADNVQDLQITYRVGAQYVTSATPGVDWARVDAVRFSLTLIGTEPIGTGGAPLARVFQHTVALRSRLQ